MLYYLRIILVLIYMMISSVLAFFACIFRPFHHSNAVRYGRLFSWGCLKILGLKITVEGKSILDNCIGTPCILIANHQTALDVITVAHFAPAGAIGIGKKSIKYIPFFGQLFWLTGNIFIDRFNRKRAINTMDRVVEIIIKKSTPVFIMPEGTRSYQKGILKFKKGAFYSAIRGQIPIVPIAISSYYKNLNFSNLRSGTVLVKVLPQVHTIDLNSNDATTLSEKCHHIIKNSVEELDSRLH